MVRYGVFDEGRGRGVQLVSIKRKKRARHCRNKGGVGLPSGLSDRAAEGAVFRWERAEGRH